MAIGYGIAVPKPEPLKRVRGRKTRAESKVKKSVRAQCAERDGHCRMHDVRCQGPSQWAHLGDAKRFKTRRMDPTVRHTVEGSLMLCELHHDQYDGRRKPRLHITPLSSAGANGALVFSY